MGIITKGAHTLLMGMSHIAIERFQPRIIGISGLAGKAITEQAIRAVMGGAKRVRMPRRMAEIQDAFYANILNTKFGTQNALFASLAIPYGVFTLLEKKSWYPEVLLLTYDGEVKELLEIARPNIAVVTALKGTQGLEETKPDAVRVLESLTSSGYALLNMDDLEVALARDRTRANVLTFGFNTAADMRIMNFLERDEGVSFKLHYGGSFVPVRLPNVSGKQVTYAAAAAALVGAIFKINLFDIAEVLSKTNFYQVKDS